MMIKSLKVFTPVVITMALLIAMGYYGLRQNLTVGPSLLFIGSCGAAGLLLDLVGHVRHSLRRNHIRRLRP